MYKCYLLIYLNIYLLDRPTIGLQKLYRVIQMLVNKLNTFENLALP